MRLVFGLLLFGLVCGGSTACDDEATPSRGDLAIVEDLRPDDDLSVAPPVDLDHIDLV